MGSPSARLNARESLRPWLESGLQFIFSPGGLLVEEQVLPVQGVATTQHVPSAGRSQPSQPVRQSAQAVAPQVQPQPTLKTPTQNFVEPWASFLRFTKPEAKVVLTYMELGLDLGGQSDSRRRSVLKNLQAHLKWPVGTINFWPVAALVRGSLQPDTEMFWRGWELWKTPHIVCFGDEALKVMLPDADAAIETHLLEHVIVHKLPPLSRLMTLLPHEQQMSIDSIVNIRL